MKKCILLGLLVLFGLMLKAQTTVTIDAATTHQTIQGFGASDAWMCAYIGEYWSEAEKEKAAKLIFSKGFDSNGNPEGIGLSRWRFNIGAGSYEQGDDSKINDPDKIERRAECFMTGYKSDGTTPKYDFANKQKGQQWFLHKAKQYGVEHLLAFNNSPPVYMTKNSRANTDSNNPTQNTNLKNGYADDFARFNVDVLEYLKTQGIEFTHISPINEPQFDWCAPCTSDPQEGCPYKNEEAAEVYRELNTALESSNLSTKIFIGEAPRWDYLYSKNTDNKDPEKLDLIDDYFNPANTSTYIGNLSRMEQAIAAHSYWINDKNNYNTTKSYREQARIKADQYGIDLYQSEYNLLGGSDNYNTETDAYLKNALYLAKIIHTDLTSANVNLWDFWTAFDRERWNQKNRFYLLPLRHEDNIDEHNYVPLDSPGGYIGDDKNLWVFGQFTRFVRPGYKRIKLSGADDWNSLMGSAYQSANNDTISIVYINWGSSSATINTNFSNLNGSSVIDITPYLTDKNNNNLTKQTVIYEGDTYTMPGLSIATLVVRLSTCDQTDITPYYSIDGAAQVNSTEAGLDAGQSITLSPTATGTGTWKWTGPGISNDVTTRELTIDDFSSAKEGLYKVVFTNATGCPSDITFDLELNPCNQTALSGSYSVNNSVQQSGSTVECVEGDNIQLISSPATGGDYIWTLPDGSTTDGNTYTISGISSSDNGKVYTAVFTNNENCESSVEFTISVCLPSAITPYADAGCDNTWTSDTDFTLKINDCIKLGPHPDVAAGWSWTGPNGFSASTREIMLNLTSIGQFGDYIGTYVNDCGVESTITYKLTLGIQDQTITFDPIPDKSPDSNDFVISATASSGLPVSFSIISGPATINGNTISLDGTEGVVIVRASQAGNAVYNPADDVDQTFEVREISGYKYVKLEATSEINGNPWTNTAEFGVLTGGSQIDITNWTVIDTDSEETTGENGAASNAIDGDPNTIWHTQWSGSSPVHPHHISIDLGGYYNISGFTYQARQDVSSNGNIKDYNIYLSTDGVNWGSPVVSGQFANTKSIQQVDINPNDAPTVSITAPSNGTSYDAGDNVTITATASDSDGSITLVKFYAGGIKIGEDATSPYECTWNNPADGKYILTVVATDNESATATSEAVSISVGSGPDYLNAYYTLTNVNSNKLLEVSGWSTSNGGNIAQWGTEANENDANKQWYFEDAGSGYYFLVNKHSNLYADVSATSTSNGANILQWNNHRGDNQKWQVTEVEADQITLTAKHSSKALTIQNDNAVQYTNTSSSDQKWILKKIGTKIKQESTTTKISTVEQSELLIFPNPAENGIVNINFGNIEFNSNAIISIFDMSGRKVYSAIANNKEMTINTNLKEGTYMFTLLNGNQRLTQRLIIK